MRIPPTGKPCDKCGVEHLTTHGWRACTAHSKQKKQGCGNPPADHQEVCKDHGATTKQAKRGAERRRAVSEAREELTRLGVPLGVNEGEAMVAMVQEAAGNVAVYRHLVQQLELDVGPDGIASHTSPEDYKTAPHPFVVAYDAERDKLVKWAKLCLDAGVAERRVRIAEQQAEQLAGVVREIVDGLTAALVAVGVERDVMGRVMREALPGIMRAAFERAAAIEAGSTEVRT